MRTGFGIVKRYDYDTEACGKIDPLIESSDGDWISSLDYDFLLQAYENLYDRIKDLELQIEDLNCEIGELEERI